MPLVVVLSVTGDPHLGLFVEAGLSPLEAISLMRMNLRVNITLGGSNISFGLPERSLINRSFLAMAMAAGLTCAIVDPLDVEIRKTIAACDLLMGLDEYAIRVLERSRRDWWSE